MRQGHAEPAERHAAGPRFADRRERASRSARNVAHHRGRGGVRERAVPADRVQAAARAKVHERPLLFVPPCINKFYILDLQPENSLVRYARRRRATASSSSAGATPDESIAHKTWDDYIERRRAQGDRRRAGDQRAPEQINTLGFCVGGTMLATALAVLAARGETAGRVELTLLTTLLDFCDTGVLDIFIDEALVQLREMHDRRQTARQPAQGQELAIDLQLPAPERPGLELRRRQLPEGRDAAAVRPAVLEQRLAPTCRGRCTAGTCATPISRTTCVKPGKLTVCGEPVDLRQDRRADLHLRLARGPHRAVAGRLRVDAALAGQEALRARRVGPHRRRDQPAREEEAQLLDRTTKPRVAGDARRLARRRRPNTRAAGGPTGPPGSSRYGGKQVRRAQARGQRRSTSRSSRRRAATCKAKA